MEIKFFMFGVVFSILFIGILQSLNDIISSFSNIVVSYCNLQISKINKEIQDLQNDDYEPNVVGFQVDSQSDDYYDDDDDFEDDEDYEDKHKNHKVENKIGFRL